MQWVMTMTYIQAWLSEVGYSKLHWESGGRHVSGQSWHVLKPKVNQGRIEMLPVS